MSDKQIKWLILAIPTITIGLWEYIRHEFLLPYISMDLGNLLSPLIVLLATITFGWRLFSRYDQLQKQLELERAERAILEERERIARELHDGIAQTVFLCSVHLQKLQQEHPHEEWTELSKSLRQIHQYVRQSISSLKKEEPNLSLDWHQQMQQLIRQFEENTGISVCINWSHQGIPLSSREKIELHACLQECLTNIQKHAHATQVHVSFISKEGGWNLTIADNGVGFHDADLIQPHHFGLRIMQERIQELQGTIQFFYQQTGTKIVIAKGTISDADSNR